MGVSDFFNIFFLAPILNWNELERVLSGFIPSVVHLSKRKRIEKAVKTDTGKG
jgi:hypothetical protein